MVGKNTGFVMNGESVFVSKSTLDRLRRQGLIHACAGCGNERAFKSRESEICEYCEEQFALEAETA